MAKEVDVNRVVQGMRARTTGNLPALPLVPQDIKLTDGTQVRVEAWNSKEQEPDVRLKRDSMTVEEFNHTEGLVRDFLNGARKQITMVSGSADRFISVIVRKG